MEILFRSPVWGQSGFELLSRNLIIALDKLGVRIQLSDKREWNLHRCRLDSEDASRLTRMMQQKVNSYAPLISQQVPATGRNTGKQFCYSLFETNRCPTPWIPEFNKIDEVWVFSKFNKNYWLESGVKRIDILPPCIDSNVFNPSIEPIKIPNKKRCVFFSQGDMTPRKNFELLIEAYVKEFISDDDVTLLIKTHHGNFTKTNQNKCATHIKTIAEHFGKKDKLPHIIFYGENIPAYDMPRFYTACDCFVLASRGEGLGLPYLEAMASGKPCIATNFGGHMDFITKENGFLLDYKLEHIEDHEYIKQCINALGHSWALANIAQLQYWMRFVYEFPDEAKKRGEQARADIEKLTPQNSALWIINKLLNGKLR